uniref:Insertion element IS630 uncharacterized 39 kDa protein ISO-IS200 39 kDa protein n=1 Tax=Erwinia piriflorinigrans CFBP 5888 TaxID=1161919 RepID=V5Z2T6_9GAMM|nr:insertion element IS630 uncharacterized 39 kDa protein ISO-IS200 39 kDa protein [Erwinia piriflorinigrans CFBP 5888]
MLMLNRGDSVSDVARTLCCARSSVGRWINWFTLYGTDGLKSLPPGRGRRWPFEQICSLLRQLVKYAPGDFGYQRSRWSTELMAIKVREITGCHLHASTVRRWLPQAGLVWRRAAPTLRIRDPHKEEKMAAINTALSQCSQENPVFYEDEVNIHLNPKSAQTGSCGSSRNAFSRPVRMKSITWRVPCTAAPGRSVTWVAVVKARGCLSA